ncbi:MAG: Uncharacterised protein [Marinobacterium sp. xm-d-530]|nr:MAG: Uncharacterised protein [Marinobacterium sp. xm-d-530]
MNSFVNQPLLNQNEISQLLASGAAVAAQARGQLNQRLNSGSSKASLMGSGTEFDDLRLFQIGDDPRQIDWRASARSQETLTRTYRNELQQPLQLVVDRNASMRFGTKKRLKVTQAARLSLWLAGIYHQQDYALGAFLLEQQPKLFDCRVGIDWLNLLSVALVAPAPPSETSETDWQSVLSQLLSEIPSGSKVFLISDFISLNTSHRVLLSELAARTSVSAFIISDPIERDPKALLGSELKWGSQRLLVEDQAALTRIEQSYLNRVSDIQDTLSQSGIPLSEVCSSIDHFSVDLLAGECHE